MNRISTLLAGVVTVSPMAVAAAPVTTSYATIVMKKGCATVVFNADPAGAPAIGVGQAIDVTADGKQCSGYVAKVEHKLSLSRLPTVEVRMYTTTITLVDAPVTMPPPPPVP